MAIYPTDHDAIPTPTTDSWWAGPMSRPTHHPTR